MALELLAFATPSAEVTELRELFFAIDSDLSGSISREEFEQAMASHPQLNRSALSALFDQIDFTKRGTISYNEFLAASLGGTARLASLDEGTVRHACPLATAPSLSPAADMRSASAHTSQMAAAPRTRARSRQP